MSSVRLFAVVAIATALSSAANAQTSTGLDAKVQSPELKAPERASLAGQLAGVLFGPADLARGAFTLPGPFAVPQDRGAMLASPFPSYSPEGGISEWGAGWQTTSLAITRMRVQGDLDYATDDLTGPFGRMVKGTDGKWYPLGLSKLVRLVEGADAITAYLPDGTQMTFGGAARVMTALGTYAWHLTEVRTVTGRKTRVDWTANASGRLFPSSVWYGGVGDDYQYRVDFAYETLAQPFEDYRSRQMLSLDRRAKTVTVLVKHATSGVFEERWHYDLGYQEEGFGPGFYLATVQQVFRSGDRPPPTTYAYNRSNEKLPSAALVSAPKVTQLLAATAADVLQPNRSTVFDAEDDGMSDLEWGYDYRLARQTDTGFTVEALPPAADAYAYCRRAPSTLNTPRVLAQMRSGIGDETQYVVDLHTDAYGTNTYFTACNRLGQQQGSATVAGSWALGPTVRLVDVNRDHRPDIVRVQYGQYRVLPNTSTATTFSFGAAKVGSLTPAFTPDTVWVHDFNGDGIPDLIARTSSQLVVWYGKGNLEFVSPGRTFTLRTASGTTITTLSSYGLTFVDANKDGLTDIVLSGTSGNATHLFMNRGSYFEETIVPGLQSVDAYTSRPVVMDAQGSGNTEVTFTKSGQGWAVALDGPETGLMAWADDGRGTVLSFEYGRAAPSPGGRQRQSVLWRVQVESSGYDVATYDYDYASPKLQSLGKFLLGYDHVTRVDPMLTHAIDFLNEDRYSGVFLASRRHDSNAPSVDFIKWKTYEEAFFQGIPWKHLKQEVSGFLDATGASVSEQTDYVTYAQDFCPETTTKTTASGVLTVTKTYVQPSAYGEALSCVWANAVEQGIHASSTLDFEYETALTVNSVGLVEKVESVTPTERWTLQTIGYRPDWFVDRVSSPGKGTTVFGYAAATGLLQSVTTPDGVSGEALLRDPIHDGVLTLKTTRGTAAFERFFRYDGQERLAKQWDDLGSATELNPGSRYEYQFATAAEPGAIYSSQLVDIALASARDAVDLLSAAGEPVVTASRIPEGWTFAGLVTRSRTTAMTRTYLRPTVGTAVDPMALDHATLLAGANEVASDASSIFGHKSLERTTYHAGVEREVTRDLMLYGGFMRLTSRENGTNATDTWMDAAKRVVAFDDEASVRYSYAYDALGRLREVTLPDGNKHRTRYDGHGRVWRVERDGVPGAARVSIETAYDPVTGLPATKTYVSSALTAGETLVRSVGFSYDTIGRISLETHTDAATGATKTFRYQYDGATPDAPTRRTTLGLLTGISGDGFTKIFEYRADGLLARRVVAFPSWRSVETALGYLESGIVGSRTVKVYDALGAQLSVSAQTYRHDSYGRVQTVKLNGSDFATFTYSANGEIRTTAFPGSNGVTIDYDVLTRRFTGSTQRTAGYTAGATQLLNARGLVDVETLTAGATSVSRTYEYSAQRFLERSSDALATYGYGFDGFGLPSAITTNGVTKAIVRSGDTLTAGSVVYKFDKLGRTIQRGDLTLAYGPDGQLASASRGGSSWSFVHDESGQRLLKRAGATPVAAYVEEGYLDASGLSERVQVAGRTVGILKNGAFTTAATDARGTVIAEANGTARFASPFGWRDVHPSTSAALDYVEKGFDADLGLVRMGVREYDPEIDQFTTPDPLVMESPKLCLENRIDCNLYAYARNAPTSVLDDTGELSYDVDTKAWSLNKGDTLQSVANQVGIEPAVISKEGTNSKIDWSRVTDGNPISIPQTVNVQVFQSAAEHLGDTSYAKAVKNGLFPAGNWKCNLFATDMADDVPGVGRPASVPGSIWPPLAGEYGTASAKISNTRVVKEADAKIGDILAFRHDEYRPDATGHTTIYAGTVTLIKGGRDIRNVLGIASSDAGTIGAGEFKVQYQTVQQAANGANGVYRRVEK